MIQKIAIILFFMLSIVAVNAQSSTPTVVPGNRIPLATDPAENVIIRPDSPGLMNPGPGQVATTPSFNIAQDQILPALTLYFLQPVASDNHAVISTVGATVFRIKVTVNSTLATDNYLKLYNAGPGFNGCASATNLIYEAVIKQSSGLDDVWSTGISFPAGISICVVGGYAKTDATAATANAINVLIGWH